MDNVAVTMARGLTAYAQNDLLDADGRPLGEVSSPHYDAESTVIRRCPYGDRRHGQPMNASALLQMTSRWPALLGFVATTVPPSPTVHQAFRACMALSTAPLLDANPVDVHLSGLYKASLGFSQVLSSLLLADDGVADTLLADLGDGEAFCRTLDDGEWLHGQLQVCAGPMPLIRQVYDVLAGLTAPPLVAPVPDALARASAQADHAVTVVGCLSVHLLKVQGCIRRGEDTGLAETPAARWLKRPPPWLRALTAVPNRPVAHVNRYFPANAVPKVVSKLMAVEGSPTAHAEALLAAWT